MLLLAMCCTSIVAAQGIEYRMGETTNKAATQPTMVRIVEGADSGQLLVVEPKLKAVYTALSNPVKAIRVRLCDRDWKDSKSITIDDTKKYAIGDAFSTDGRLHVLLSCAEEQVLKVRHVALDASSLDILADKTMAEAQLMKGDETYVWLLASPNGLYHGVVYAVWSEKQESSVVAMLFDSAMNKRWEQRLEYSDVSDVIVTDDGTIVTIRMGAVEDNKSLTAFRINKATAEGVKHGQFVLNADVSDVALLNSQGGKVLATALEGEGGYGLLRLGSLGSRKYTGLWGLVFDLDKGEISVGNRHPFTDEELMALANGDEESTPDKRWLYYVGKLDCCQTANGGVALYQHSWHEATRDMRTGMTTSETVRCKGILVVQADMDGMLTVNRIPQNNQYANWPKVGADVFAHGKRIYVVTNESKDEADEYTPGRPAKRSKSFLFANTALAVYWFNPDGTAGKRVVERERKALLSSPLSKGHGNRFHFLTISSLAPYISTLTLPAE